MVVFFSHPISFTHCFLRMGNSTLLLPVFSLRQYHPLGTFFHAGIPIYTPLFLPLAPLTSVIFALPFTCSRPLITSSSCKELASPHHILHFYFWSRLFHLIHFLLFSRSIVFFPLPCQCSVPLISLSFPPSLVISSCCLLWSSDDFSLTFSPHSCIVYVCVLSYLLIVHFSGFHFTLSTSLLPLHTLVGIVFCHVPYLL